MKWRYIALVVLAGSTFLFALTSKTTAIETAASLKRPVTAKCAIPPLKAAYADAKSVFVGTVLSVEQNERGKTFEFQVEKYWKGSKKKKIKVTVSESTRYQAFYQAGGKYLVFARENGDGELIDGRCSRSKDISGAAADIKGLGKAKVVR